MKKGISARRGLLAAFITAAFMLCLAGSAAAAWNPLAPFNYSFSYAEAISVEYNADGSAHSVWVYDDGTFREFSADGQTQLYSFQVDYTFASGELSNVAGIAADHANGLLYVTDRDNHRVLAFDIGDGTPDPLFQAPGGTPTECPGGSCPTASSAEGSFDEPSDIDVVGNEVFVLDSNNTRVQVFDTQLNHLRTISDPNWVPGIPDVTNGRVPVTMAVNRANGNVITSMTDPYGIEEHTADGAFVRTITTDFSWSGPLELDHLNNVLYVGSGPSIVALDYTTGAEIATAVNYESGETYFSIYDIALQPVERQLINSYVYEFAVDTYRSDIVDRWSYDAAPTCQEFSVGTAAPNPVAVQLSCTDTSPVPQVTYEITAQPAGGTLVGSTATGAFTYTPNAGFDGTDTFKYRARSGTGTSREYTGTIAVLTEVPVIRKTANLSRSSGDIFVKLPGSNEWVRLEKDALVPVGTIIDAADGYCVLTFANADGTLYTGTFWGGVFEIQQTSGDEPFHVLKLRDDEFPDAPSQAASAASTSRAKGRAAGIAATKKQSRAAAKKGKKKNKLWGKGKGKFRTSGNGSSGSVRGTRWSVTNYTNGTVTQVTEGTVVVRDFYRKKSITLRRGQSYFADKNWKKNRRATARAKPRFTG